MNPSCRQSAIHLLLLADHLEEDHTAQVIHRKDLKNRQQKDLQEKLLSGKQKKEKELVNT